MVIESGDGPQHEPGDVRGVHAPDDVDVLVNEGVVDDRTELPNRLPEASRLVEDLVGSLVDVLGDSIRRFPWVLSVDLPSISNSSPPAPRNSPREAAQAPRSGSPSFP